MEPRISDPPEVKLEVVAKLISEGRRPTIQFSAPSKYPPDLLRQVNELCREFGEALDVRFYAHYGTAFDVKILDHLPDVRSLLLDCLDSIENGDKLGEMTGLSRLALGVYGLSDPAFLNKIPLENLTRLTLSENAKRNFDLAPLRLASRLEGLFIQGHSRNIDAIAELPRLEKLALSCISKKQELSFLNRLSALRSLRLLLGGRENIDEFHHGELEKLSIVWVRGLESLGDFSRFPRLNDLWVEDQLQLRSLEVTGIPLEFLDVFNCKNLASISGLDTLGQLKHFRVSGTQLDYDALLNRDWPASMEVVWLQSKNRKWNEQARAKLDAREFKPWTAGRHRTDW